VGGLAGLSLALTGRGARFGSGAGAAGQIDCTLICPANVTVGNDLDQCGAVVTYPPPDVDPQCGDPNCEPPSGSFFPVGSTTVTCTGADGRGDCTFAVTVNDTQAPSITCPADVTAGNDPGQCGAVVAYSPPEAADNCPGVAASCSPPSGSFFPIGSTQVTCTATDAAGNTSSCSFTVTVNDTEAPTITCPANIAVDNDPGQCDAVVSYLAPTTGDNCPDAAAACSPPSGSAFPVGTTTVTCTATDAADNTSSCSFTVTVGDTEAPTITCPADQTVEVALGATDAVMVYPPPTPSDNCSVVVACLPPSGSAFPIGTTTTTCTATDAAGSTATCAFAVIVQEPPASTPTETPTPTSTPTAVATAAVTETPPITETPPVTATAPAPSPTATVALPVQLPSTGGGGAEDGPDLGRWAPLTLLGAGAAALAVRLRWPGRLNDGDRG
jgi:hypothetical protein